MNLLTQLFIFISILQLNRLTLGREDGSNDLIKYSLDIFEVIKDEPKIITLKLKKPITNYLMVALNYTDSLLKVSPNAFTFTPNVTEVKITITGMNVQSLTYIDFATCQFDQPDFPCTPEPTDSFLRIRIIHSDIISIFVIITGWIYFLAWSISFYPQIYLNFKRKSVVGLNFDFLLLNIIGFTCYTIYNVLMYYDSYVQDLYIHVHKRSLIPVLFNDVVFAVHALFACIVTAVQCFIYTRENQKVSYTCYGLSSVLILTSIVSCVLSLFNVISWLQFINSLSYLKMIVTLSKYFPQVLLNYRRKSTIGWSIGNVLLDFTGGFMDIVQMILQGSNTNDWSGFYGNPVKFGLGLVSMIFDVVFIIQHYCLYKHSDERENGYEGIAPATESEGTMSPPSTTFVSHNDEV
uniref:Cystinosin homolog n=1 Tax=Parastrongyloides trichosuri TaxID=131310 RepID=A0A0N5A388_PARTI